MNNKEIDNLLFLLNNPCKPMFRHYGCDYCLIKEECNKITNKTGTIFAPSVEQLRPIILRVLKYRLGELELKELLIEYYL